MNHIGTDAEISGSDICLVSLKWKKHKGVIIFCKVQYPVSFLFVNNIPKHESLMCVAKVSRNLR